MSFLINLLDIFTPSSFSQDHTDTAQDAAESRELDGRQEMGVLRLGFEFLFGCLRSDHIKNCKLAYPVGLWQD